MATRRCPARLNQVVFGTGVKTIPAGNGTTAFRTMASTPEGQYIIVFTGTGNAYIYDAAADDFTLGKQIFTTQTGYLGPVSAGPRGQYYIVNGVLLNSSLTPIGNIPSSTTTANTGTTTAACPGSAAPRPPRPRRDRFRPPYVGANTYAVFINPVRTNANAAATDAGIIQILDMTTATRSPSPTRWKVQPPSSRATPASITPARPWLSTPPAPMPMS